MPRMRTLKHGFFTNDQLADLPFETRLLFAGLWLLADKAGRILDRPRRIKGELFPYDDVDIDAMLCSLASKEFISRYEVDGTCCIEITKFLDHQRPHPNEPDSVIPPCPPAVINNGRRRTKHSVAHEKSRVEEEKGISPHDNEESPAINNTRIHESKIHESIDPVKETVPVPKHVQVFQFWQSKSGHPRAQLDAKREKAIKSRLKDGYTVEDLCVAVEGCLKSPYHQGQNDSATVYDDIELICRDGKHVDSFIKTAGRPDLRGISSGTRQSVSAIQDWLEERNGTNELH